MYYTMYVYYIHIILPQQTGPRPRSQTRRPSGSHLTDEIGTPDPN